MKTKLPALLLTLTLSLTACGAAPAATGSQSAPDLSGAHALPQTMEETPPVDLPTLRLTLVDGAGTDTLLLAGETAGEVYTVPADSFPLTLDGEPADASVLEDGMPITLAYTGIEESFPARLSVAAAETYSLGTEKNPGGGFYDLCDELSIPHPKTWYFSAGSEGPETLPLDAFPYPCVAKPSDTTKFQNADVAHKRKAYEIETPAELAQVWQDVRASDYDGDFLIQDFIPGGDEALRILNTFSDAEGNLVAVSGGITALQDHSPTALGNPLCILGEREPTIIEHARKFLKRTKYQGYGNFDIKYDARTGEYNFFEINVRAGRSTYFTNLGGINFVSLVVDQYVLGKQLPYREAYRPFVYNCVPPYVLKRSILDKELLQRVLATLKKTRSPYPLFYTKDSLLHNFWAMTMYYNQIRKFKRYFWDTDGHQYK